MRSISLNLLFFAALVALQGCAGSTPSSLLASAPETTYASEKSSKVVSDCIVASWENTPSGIANIRTTESGYRIALHFGDRLRYLAEVEGMRLGSRTSIYIGNMTHAIGQHPAVVQAAKC